MSYTPPSSTQVNFQYPLGGRYSSPTYTAVDFSWQDGTPTVIVVGSSRATFVPGYSVSINSGSIVSFQHGVRDFVLSSGASASFVTDLRAFDIQASSAALFRYGAQMRIESGSTPGFVLRDIQPRTYDIDTTSAVSGTAQWTFSSTYDLDSRSIFYPGRGYIHDIRFVGSAKSAVRFRSGALVEGALSAASRSTFVPKATSVIGVAFSAAPSSVVVGRAKVFVPSAGSVDSSSVADFYGLASMRSDAAVTSSSAALFVSDYGFEALPELPVDVDVAWVKTAPVSVQVLTP